MPSLHVKQTGMLVVSFQGVNFFGMFGLADASFLSLCSFLFYYCTYNKLSKVNVGPSCRIAHEEIVLLFLRGQSLSHAFRGLSENFKSISRRMRMASLQPIDLEVVASLFSTYIYG